MIARFNVLLPFGLLIPSRDEFEPLNWTSGDSKITIHRPSQSALRYGDFDLTTGVPLFPLDQLNPVSPPQLLPNVKVDGEHDNFLANLLIVDVTRECFDRRRGLTPESYDPDVSVIFGVINQFLARLRILIRSPRIKHLSPEQTVFCIRYLSNDGEALVDDPMLARLRAHVFGSFHFDAVTACTWEQFRLSSAELAPPIWDTFFLDAQAALPDINAAVVLAFSALELFVADCLRRFAQSSPISVDLWKWIMEGRGKEPSVADQYDVLLRAITGHSLKDRNDLWDVFTNLRLVRNSVVHEGKLMSKGSPVSRDTAQSLVLRAGEIIDWVESLLPEAERRPRTSSKLNIETVKDVLPQN